MGAGKTTFTRALAAGLRVARPDRVCSPTFNVCLVHQGPIPLVHVDLFRLAELGEEPSPAFSALGLEELVERTGLETPVAPGGVVVVIEWADLWTWSFDALQLHLRRSSSGSEWRDLEIQARGESHEALARAWLDGLA